MNSAAGKGNLLETGWIGGMNVFQHVFVVRHRIHSMISLPPNRHRIHSAAGKGNLLETGWIGGVNVF
jgi:hypothetical protein